MTVESRNELRANVARMLEEWRDAGAPTESVVSAIEDFIWEMIFTNEDDE